MGKNKKRKKDVEAPDPSPAQTPTPRATRAIVLAASLAAIIAASAWLHFHASHAPSVNLKDPNFALDIAPLIYGRCSSCHHAGGSAPFALLDYAAVSKRAAQITKVTQSRYMPPWLPAHGFGEFEGERYLSDDEISMLKVWVARGAPEGDPARAPAAPHFDAGWCLGTPDLVVQLPRPFTLPAEGRDVYRNFTIPVPIAENKYVKGFEFRPGSARVHHAFLYIDKTAESRHLDGRESEPGWGVEMGSLPSSVEIPEALFPSWQPGKVARIREDMAWSLEKGTDLVLQLHMQPGGKPEPIQPSIALYFADRPGTFHPAYIPLRCVTMDIPANEKAYTARANYTFSMDVDAIAFLPHTHYLGKDLRGFATLPDGSRKWLFWIKDWDFAWQGDYAFKQPLFLPKGSRVDMEYTFDNSASNPRNPSQPPKRVQFGTQSTDEMAELWLQVVPHDESQQALLKAEHRKATEDDGLALNEALALRNPSDVQAHSALGKIQMARGQLTEAEAHFRSAIKIAPNSSDTHYNLGYLLQDRKNLSECIAEFYRAVQLDHTNYAAFGGLGLAYLHAGKLPQAEACLVEAVRLHPNDAVLEGNLALVKKAMGK